MDINNRKTALNDDSVLYQKRDASLNRQNVKELDRQGKVQYFKDYYLGKVVIGIVGLIFAGNLIYNICFRNPETILNLACIGNTQIVQTTQLGTDLRDVFGLTSKDQDIYITNYNLTDYNQNMVFSTHVAANDIDLIICDAEQFEHYAQQGMFANLQDVLDASEYEALSDSILSGTVMEFDINGDPVAEVAQYPMVVDITGNTFLANYETYGETLYIGFCCNSERIENAKILLDYLCR